MAVTWQSQPNSARSTIGRRRRLASGPASQEAVAPPQPLALRPPATPSYSRLRRKSSGYRVISVDVISLSDEGSSRRKSYALFSPYVPLPAIGGDAPGETDKTSSMVKNGGDKVQDESETSTDRPRFLRERTYSVIEPKFVRGPSQHWAQPVRPNNVAWSRQPERPLSPARPTSPHLPNLIAHHRRLSTPEMLDDVQLPQDLDLDEDIFSEDLVSKSSLISEELVSNPSPTGRRRVTPDIVRRRGETNVRPTPQGSIDLNEELPSEISREQRNTKLVTEVTDSLKRLWTRL